MPKFRFDISMSLDGFIAGPNQSEENPLCEGGMQLHEWIFELEPSDVVEAPGVVHLRYCVVK